MENNLYKSKKYVMRKFTTSKKSQLYHISVVPSYLLYICVILKLKSQTMWKQPFWIEAKHLFVHVIEQFNRQKLDQKSEIFGRHASGPVASSGWIDKVMVQTRWLENR